MKSPSLKYLPPPPKGKSGWPWTEESELLPEKMPDGRSWPKISIVTPSYNQGEFLEETIRAVLLQNYPNLEYFIMDGGSTDNSVEIIKTYKPWLTYWVSEKDKGQADAINKGFERVTGDILAWLNSDDTYEPDILKDIASNIDFSKDKNIVAGNVRAVESNGKEIRVWKTRKPNFYALLNQYQLYLMRGCVFMPNQPSVFWHRSIYDQIGPLKEELEYSMDYEYWLRILKAGYIFVKINKVLSNYRFHDKSKTFDGWRNCAIEWKLVGKEYFSELSLSRRLLMKLYLCFYLIPISFTTLPYRATAYVLGVKRG